MNVAMGYCQKDREQAVQWLESVKRMGALRQHRLFLMPEFGCAPIPEILPCTVLVDNHRQASNWNALTPAADPSGPNSKFRQFARYFHYNKIGAWFFCEPDCVLLTPDALDRLEAEYVACHKEFMGTYVNGPVPRLNGTMICPEDAALIPSIALPMRAPDGREIVFDIACARDVMPRAHRTNLIQNVHGTAPFTSREDFDARVSKEAVVFHSCKDGTIYQFLSGATHAESQAEGSQCAESARLPEADPPAQFIQLPDAEAPRYIVENGAMVEVDLAQQSSEPNPNYGTPAQIRMAKARKALAAKRATGWKPKKRRKKRKAK